MYTYNQVVYMVLDFLKISSDDAYYTPDHVIFLLNKFRAYVLKNKYENSSETPSDSNYQTMHLTLTEKDRIEGIGCSGKYLVSNESLPDSLDIGTPTFSGKDLFQGDMAVVSPNRFKYVGFDRWTRNITYVTFEGGKVYIKSCNPLAYYLQEGTYRDIFADPLEAAAASGEYDVDENGDLCNPLEVEFALEDNLLPLVMQYVVKELSGGLYKPKDDENNADDDLSKLAQFIRSYVKSPLRQQIDS
mgnify:CR=1 FL=1